MIDLNKSKREFINYTSKFNLKDDEIKRKVGHSLRVMEISTKIAKSLNLSEEKIEVATLIGLLHDIGRFEQKTKFNTFYDVISIDHGDLGVQILKENDYLRKYIETDKYDEIILTAIKNHNKFEINEEVKGDELLFSKIIRDADKIDILYETFEIFWKGHENEVENSIISQEIEKSFEEKHQLKRTNNNVNSSPIDKVCSRIALIFDINFVKSLEIINREDYINRIIDRFNFKNIETREKIEKIRKIANDFVEEKIK